MKKFEHMIILIDAILIFLMIINIVLSMGLSAFIITLCTFLIVTTIGIILTI